MPIPKDASSESSRRDDSDADLFDTDTINTIPTIAVEIPSMEKSAQGYVIYTVLFGSIAVARNCRQLVYVGSRSVGRPVGGSVGRFSHIERKSLLFWRCVNWKLALLSGIPVII